MANNKKSKPVDWEPFLAGISSGKAAIEYGPNRKIFSQGDPADSVFYLRQGKVKLAVRSKQGREAIVANLGAGEFFGEGCLAGQPSRMATAISVGDCTLTRVEKPTMVRMLYSEVELGMYSVCQSSPPQVMFPVFSGTRIVPRCSPTVPSTRSKSPSAPTIPSSSRGTTG